MQKDKKREQFFLMAKRALLIILKAVVLIDNASKMRWSLVYTSSTMFFVPEINNYQKHRKKDNVDENQENEQC